MARYHFNLYDGASTLDEDGFEFASLEDVRKDAIQFLGAALIDARERIFTDGSWRLDVSDGEQLVLFSVHVLAFEAAASLPHMYPGQFSFSIAVEAA